MTTPPPPPPPPPPEREHAHPKTTKSHQNHSQKALGGCWALSLGSYSNLRPCECKAIQGWVTDFSRFFSVASKGYTGAGEAQIGHCSAHFEPDGSRTNVVKSWEQNRDKQGIPPARSFLQSLPKGHRLQPSPKRTCFPRNKCDRRWNVCFEHSTTQPEKQVRGIFAMIAGKEHLRISATTVFCCNSLSLQWETTVVTGAWEFTKKSYFGLQYITSSYFILSDIFSCLSWSPHDLLVCPGHCKLFCGFRTRNVDVKRAVFALKLDTDEVLEIRRRGCERFIVLDSSMFQLPSCRYKLHILHYTYIASFFPSRVLHCAQCKLNYTRIIDHGGNVM